MAEIEISSHKNLVPVQVPDEDGAVVLAGDLANRAIRVNVVAGSSSGTGDVNITEIGGNPVTTTIPVSGTVSVAEPVTVDATDLDIRNLTFAADKVDASGTVLGAGTNNIGDVDVLTLPSIPAGTNNIGDVDVLTLPAIPAGNNNIGDVDIASIAAGDNNIGNVDIVTMPNVTLAAGTNTNEVVGDVAHDAPNAGNPVLIAASAETMADSVPANRVSLDGDATRLSATDGALFVIPTGPQSWTYHEDSSSALTDASVHAAPTAGLSLYVTDIVFSLGAATAINIFFEEGATKVLGPWYLEAINGRGMALHFGTPKKITTATALTVTTSAAVAHSIDIQGFIAPG